MAAARFYSSTSGSIDLTASIVAGDTSISVSTTTGLPGTTPFTLVLDPGTNSEEIVTATNVSGLTITVTRGVDGSSATSHSAGVGNVRHMATARDFREPQEHIGASVNVHGIGATGSVVGTDTSQTLTNKTAQASAAGVQGLIVKGAASQTASYLEVQDSSGAMVWKVTPDVGGTVQLAGGTAVVNASGPANLLGYVAKFTAAAVGGVAAIFKRSASGSTADIVQIQSETGTVLAKFDSAGNLSAPNFQSGAWTTYTPTWGSTGTAPAIGNGSITGRYAQNGKTVHVHIKVRCGSTTTFGTGYYTFTAPVARSGSESFEGLSGLFNNGATFKGAVGIDQSSTTVFSCVDAGGAGAVGPATPATWTSTVIFDIRGTYEAA